MMRMKAKFMAGLVAGAAAAMAAAPAMAQLARGQGVALNKGEIVEALFGVDMTGFSPTFRFSWRECIDPRGDTLYETPDGIQKGRLRPTEDGLACFAYEDTTFTEESCYRVERNGKGFIFRSDTGLDGAAGMFITTAVVRGVKGCAPDERIG